MADDKLTPRQKVGWLLLILLPVGGSIHIAITDGILRMLLVWLITFGASAFYRFIGFLITDKL